MASFIGESNVKFPYQFQTVIEIDGIKTHYILTKFTDVVFLVITQINKFGTLVKSTYL